MLSVLASLLQRLGLGLLALLILFEEWGWEPLQAALARLARLPLLRRAEAWVGRLPPRAALVVLLLPTLLLLPVKLLALGLIARGHALAGLAAVLLAKLLGTAIVARLFTLTRPALLQLPWFAALYPRWRAWKQGLLDRARGSWLWRRSRQLKCALRRRWRR